MPPSFRFPPRAGGTQQRFPLRSRGNLTEGVFKKCRAMSFARGTKQRACSVPSACRGKLQEGGQALFPPCFTRGTARHARSVPPALRQCIGRMDRLSINRLPPFAPLINGYPKNGID
jgi:hypothetical protein